MDLSGKASQTLNPESRVVRRMGVPWKELDNTGIVLDLTSGDYFELDEVGVAIWRSLDGNKTLAECAKEIASSYAIAPEVVEPDVQAFAEELLRKNLIAVLQW